MKLALVNNFHPYAGAGKYAFDLFETYKKKRIDVDMIYLESNDNKIPNQKRVRKIKKDFIFSNLNKTILAYYYFPTKIPGGYDLYHVASQFLAKVAKYKKPCVITHLDIIPILFPKGKLFIVGIMLKGLLKYYQFAEKIIAISDVVRDELLKLDVVSEEKVSVIYPGYNEKIYKPISKRIARKKLGLPKDKKIILNIGSEDPLKGVPILLKALRKLQKMIPDIMLVRIGSTDSSNKPLKKGLDIREYHGIPEKQMSLFYNSADVFSAPFIYAGGFVYPPLEAMACGIPTIVTKAVEVFRGGCLIVPHTVESFTNAMYDVLSNTKLNKKLSKAALRKAKEFTLTKEAEKIYKIYEEVLL